MPPQETCKIEIKNKKLEGYPEEELNYGQKLANPPSGDEVVITGLAGNFPNARDVGEFQSNLYNGVDMVSDDNRRWSLDHPEAPKRSGMLYDIEKFDPGYFGIHHRQADSADPMVRMLLERAVEAVMDAGINPSELEGTNTGVFVGACVSETQIISYTTSCAPQSFAVTGNHKSMIANRISYYLKLKGPSIGVDTACSSSLYALEHAYKAIRDGNCDGAIVGGTNLCLHPFASIQFFRLGVLSREGYCKSFDDDGNGYARSEGIAAIFLQKSKDAKRIYARVIHAKTNCDGYKEEGITFPSSSAQKQLYQDFYQECLVDPKSLSFLEAHGTGTKVGDPEEVLGIGSTFCKGRDTPLLIGSVKSNIGHSEPTSGLCSVIKVIIAAENDLIPPNLHFLKPRKGLKFLETGRLKVVTKPTAFDDNRGLFGINSFGFGGGNCHVLLEWNHKEKKYNNIQTDNFPRLICVSGRLESSITSILDDIKKRPLDVEYIALFHNLFRQDIKNHLYRGYSIVSQSGELSRNQVNFSLSKKPIYLVLSDFGASWSRIASHLTIVSIFKVSIENVFKLLTSEGFDLSTLPLNGNSRSFVTDILGNMAVQIGIADILKKMKLEFGGLFGFGINELVCGYFEGTLTLEETVRSTCQIVKMLQNGDKNLTESQQQKLLHEIIVEPKPRRWKFSSTAPLTLAKHFVNSSNVQSTFQNLRNHVTKNGVILEVGHRRFKVTDQQVNHLRFEFVENTNSFISLLDILGSLYIYGQNPQIDELYPKVQFPVSRGTPMISPLIKWNHHKDWSVMHYASERSIKNDEDVIKINIKSDTWSWLVGHIIDGRNLFPGAGYLYLVWELMSVTQGMLTADTSVVFENCKFLRATQLTPENLTELTVMIQRGSGEFEISESGDTVCTGRIYFPNNPSSESVSLPIPMKGDGEESIKMETRDVYKEMRLRGYGHADWFKRIKECNVEGTKGLVKWENNWVCFMDNMLQMRILQGDMRSLHIPIGIRRLSIDARKHLTYVQKFGESSNLPVYGYRHLNMIKCGGIEVRGITTASISRRKQCEQPVLEKYEFLPNCSKLKIEEAIRVNVQLILENLQSVKVRVLEIIDDATKDSTDPLATIVHEILGDLPLVTPEIKVLSKQSLPIPNVTVENQTLIEQRDWTLAVGTNLLQRPTVLHQALAAIEDRGFILSREGLTFEPCKASGLEILTVYTTESEKLVLFAKHVQLQPPTVIDVTNTTEKFEWLSTLQKSLANNKSVVIIAQKEPLSGILGLVNCIRKEPGGGGVKCVFTLDDAPPFDTSIPFYSEQLAKNLAINIYKNSQWGTYRHLLLEPQMEVESEHCFVNVTQRGDLSSLKWIQGPLTTNTLLKHEQELINVYYAALNFRDIMTATGRINPDVVIKDRTRQECVQGLEFSGRTSEGKRVFGMIGTGAISTMVAADKQMIWELPDRFTLEEGATIPVVYATVLQAFFHTTTIKRGDTILIHAGSGGVGQAAITVALHCGLTIYTTVGTKEKRDFLKKRFPQLNDCQIGNSRDTSFETMILQQTKGRGVDFVLNSLAEEKLEASIRCLARGGKFLEIGKFDLVNNRNLQLLFIEKEASFHGVMLDDMFEHVNKLATLQKLMQTAIESGMIKPLVRTVFKEQEVEEAFRFMAGGKHIGKVLIKIREEEEEKVIPSSVKLANGIPRYYCDPDNVYVIAGGLGGFGLELADWLILRGARKIVLASRKGLKTGYESYRIRFWKSYGTIVTISTADITSKRGCEDLLKEANSLGKVEAIFNLAVVLKDAILENQTIANFQESLGPKAVATKNLDEVSRKLCPSLRNFVVFSSVSCGRGNAGQTNYGMANSIMERICEKRKDDGFPALAIQWGAVGDVGLVADMQKLNTQIEIGGTLTQSITSCLQVMDQFLNQKNAIVSSMVVAEKRRGGVETENIVDAVANIIGIRDVKTVSPYSTLAELGMDSMSAVEIKQILELEFDLVLTTKDMRSITFSKLQEIQEGKLSANSGTEERLNVGLEMILRLMNDEMTSQLPIVQIKSRSEDINQSPRVILFPGLEGASKVFDPLVANLSVDAKCVQFPCDRLDKTIEDMAKHLLTVVEPLVTKSKPFNIVAYSFGTVMALEVVSLLEAKGYAGTLICIDGSPEMVKTLATRSNDSSSIAHLETNFLCQILLVMTQAETISKITKKLQDCQSFDERLTVCEEIVQNNSSYSKEFFRKWSTSTINRIKALNGYHPRYKIKSKIRLFKPKHLSVSNLPEDYNLSNYCENVEEIRVFEGNHLTILDNVAVAEAINEAASTATTECNRWQGK